MKKVQSQFSTSEEEERQKNQNLILKELDSIRLLNANKSAYIKARIDEIYKVMEPSAKGGDLDPIIYFLEQNKSENQQRELFKEIQEIQKELTSKYNNILSKFSGLRTPNTDSPEITREKIKRDLDLLDVEFGEYKAIIVNKSVILPKVNQIKELQTLFDIAVERMKNSVVKITYVGDIIQTGYSIANLYKEISDSFYEKAKNPAYANFSDNLNQNGLRFLSIAQRKKNDTDKAALPGLLDRLGRDTTPSGDTSSTVALSGAINEMARFAKDHSVKSDKRFRNYWDSLMMESIDPVELGTIIEEKPKHGDKTIKEEQELHGTKKKKSKFKANRRFKKN